MSVSGDEIGVEVVCSNVVVSVWVSWLVDGIFLCLCDCDNDCDDDCDKEIGWRIGGGGEGKMLGVNSNVQEDTGSMVMIQEWLLSEHVSLLLQPSVFTLSLVQQENVFALVFVWSVMLACEELEWESTHIRLQRKEKREGDTIEEELEEEQELDDWTTEEERERTEVEV